MRTTNGWFNRELERVNPPKPLDGECLYVLHDQLNDRIGLPASHKPGNSHLLLIESHGWWDRRPYHRQKIALVIANQRSFALEMARKGWHVDYRITDRLFAAELTRNNPANWPVLAMTPAEREMRVELAPVVEKERAVYTTHDGWLTTTGDFEKGAGNAPWRMDAFYRYIRRRTVFLMEDGKPIGGKFSFDGDNRKPWKGRPTAPKPPTFGTSPLKDEVAELLTSRFGKHPGHLDMTTLPVTRNDADKLWRWARRECLEHFGTFEDAMSVISTGIFHTRISSLLNIHRLLPSRIITDALGMDIPMNSKEGFLRQILGWREFVRHVHEATEGFRKLPDGTLMPVGEAPGNGGYTTWKGESWSRDEVPPGLDGGAAGGHLDMTTPLPPAWWGVPSGLHCLDRVVSDVWREGWSHHITRLMVLSNIATLLDVSPRELTDWFWVAYTDAWDWVVEPNVLAMGTFSVGEVMTTKPYVAGSAYINRMSDYCGECAFQPNGNCPIRRLYWAFLERHREKLEGNPRMFQMYNNLGNRKADEKEKDLLVYREVREKLLSGQRLDVEFFDQ